MAMHENGKGRIENRIRKWDKVKEVENLEKNEHNRADWLRGFVMTFWINQNFECTSQKILGN